MHKEGRFEGSGGIGLYWQSWDAGAGKPSIVIVHGIGEHSSRYRHVADHFTAAGYAVYAYDHRGNGRSDGKRGHINSFSEYIEDLRAFVEFIAANPKPIILGHSLGGLIAIRFAMQYPDLIRAVIASSPALGLSMKVPLWKRCVAYPLSIILPAFALTDTSIATRYLTHDNAVCRAYDEDALVHHKRSARFFVEFVRTLGETSGTPHRLTVPSLILQAGDDRIVSEGATVRFFGGLAADKKSLKVYKGFYHEILNEIKKAEVFRDIDAWLASLAA